jgi:hypothetical protein
LLLTVLAKRREDDGTNCILADEEDEEEAPSPKITVLRSKLKVGCLEAE